MMSPPNLQKHTIMLEVCNAIGLQGPITEKLSALDAMFAAGKIGTEQKKKDGKFVVLIDGKEVAVSLAALKSTADALGWELTIPKPIWARKA